MSITLKPNQSLVSCKQALAMFARVLESLDTPVSLSVYLQLKYNCYDDLVNRKIDPAHYNSADSLRRDLQAVKGLQKSVFLPTTIDKRKAAVETFWKAERKCGETNERFNKLMYEGGLAALNFEDPEMFSMLMKAQNQIRRILGKIPSETKFRFGPGVTSLIRDKVTLPRKYSREVHVSPELYPFFRDIIGPLWGKFVTDVKVVGGNNVSFVPKNAKTERTVAVEPHVNGYAQLGLGQLLRERLRRYINLDTGQEVNRFLARLSLIHI